MYVCMYICAFIYTYLNLFVAYMPTHMYIICTCVSYGMKEMSYGNLVELLDVKDSQSLGTGLIWVTWGLQFLGLLSGFGEGACTSRS